MQRSIRTTCPRRRCCVKALTGLETGGGGCFRLHWPGLVRLREELAADWAPWLTPQDRQGFRPHVTVQNKVEPAVARALLAWLGAGFVRFENEGVAIRLWRYLGGPWEALSVLELAVREG